MALDEQEVEQVLEAVRMGMSSPEKHLKEWQKAHLKTMVSMGMDPKEAKLRALTIGLPRDIDERVPYTYQEFPKMVYHTSGLHRVVNSHEEHLALGDEWVTTPTAIKKSWRSKATDVYTKWGIKVEQYHADFLKDQEVPGIETIAQAAIFIDTLSESQQEEFLLEATKWNLAVPEATEVVEDKPKGKSKAKSA